MPSTWIGSATAGFDHAQALIQIGCPVLLLHADFETQENGTFNGAIDQEDANRIIHLIPNAGYRRVKAKHVIHLDKPLLFIEEIKNFFDGLQGKESDFTASPQK